MIRSKPNHTVAKRLAEPQGGDVNDFAMTTARQTIIRLSIEDQPRFVELLLSPPALTPAMERAREAHERLTQESS